MALLQKAIVHYYPQCSGMSSVLDGNDCENGSVTPLRYVPKRRSGIPSATDLTGLDALISSTADFKEKPRRRSTVAFRVKPRRSTAASVKVKPPSRSTAVSSKAKPPSRSTANATKAKPPSRNTAAMVHSRRANLLTSTIISMPDAIENENYLGNVDAINAVV